MICGVRDKNKPSFIGKMNEGFIYLSLPSCLIKTAHGIKKKIRSLFLEYHSLVSVNKHLTVNNSA